MLNACFVNVFSLFEVDVFEDSVRRMLNINLRSFVVLYTCESTACLVFDDVIAVCLYECSYTHCFNSWTSICSHFWGLGLS